MPLRPIQLHFFSAGVGLMLLVAACNTDAVIQTEYLLGRWELRKALRNQKQTGNLDGTYFSFKENGTVETNLTGMDETSDFELKKKEILQKSAQPLVYQVKSFSDSALVLVTTMRGIEFELELVRAPEPAPVQEEQMSPDSIMELEMDTVENN